MGIFDKVLLTVDFDRTLTGPDSNIPERNLEAIRYFTENGGTFTVNTGRSTTTMRNYLHTLPVNAPFLLYNGSAAYGDGELSLCRPIDLPMWETLDWAMREFPHMNLELQAVDNHYLINPRKEFEEFYDAVGWGHATAEHGRDYGPFLKFSFFGKPYKNAVATYFEGDEAEVRDFDRVMQAILDKFGDKVEVFRAAPRIIDVHAKGVSKIRAARDLQARLGKEILVCVGDAENDATMLDGADYAYCPADGVVADRYENVCPCGEGAVADVIYKKIPAILEIQP